MLNSPRNSGKFNLNVIRSVSVVSFIIPRTKMLYLFSGILLQVGQGVAGQLAGYGFLFPG
jgi:hypothetical protein